MKKSLITLAAIAMVSTPAFAINNTFKFRVFSSGADIFPCNAGILHKQVNAKDGYTIDTDNDKYGTYGSEIVDSVTETTPAGSYYPDFMSYKVVSFDEWTEEKNEIASGKKYAAAGNSFQYIFSGKEYKNLSLASLLSTPHKSNDVNKIISSLDFVLSSENFGAKYFVDVCYYSPQFLDHTANNGRLTLKSKIGFSNLVNGRDYLEKAEVDYDVTVYCDGTYRKGISSQEFAQQDQLVTALNTTITGGNSTVPNKCVVRYTFSENNTDRRNHAAHGGIFTLFTDITDPVEL